MNITPTKKHYNRVMREFRNWKYYRGGMADDIWIYDPAAKKVENITNNIAQDIIPMWIGEEIYFISDRDRTMNIFVYNSCRLPGLKYKRKNLCLQWWNRLLFH